MKNMFMVLTFAVIATISSGQSSDPLVGKCMASAGSESKYLKDYRIQLGKTTESSGPRYKASISLWKDMKYRFTMCNSDDSKGKLIMFVIDDANKTVVSSFDKKNGKVYSSVDFICSKSGIYQVNFDFSDDEAGLGVGMISIIR